MTFIELLRYQMDDAWRFLERAMDGVDDNMIHWEPAPGSWGLRDREGHWCLDFHTSDKTPPGPKTIGWLAAHLGACKEIHFDMLFGPGKKKWDELVIPGNADELRKYLKAEHRLLREKLDLLGPEDLKKPAPKPSDIGKDIAVWQVLWYDIYHDIEHAGQIFQVRNEYLNRSGFS